MPSNQPEDKKKKAMIEKFLRRRRQILRLPPDEKTERIVHDLTKTIMEAIGSDQHFQEKIRLTLDPSPYLEKHPAKIGLTREQKAQQARPLVRSSHELNSFLLRLGLPETVGLLSETISQIMRLDPKIKRMISVGSGNGILEASLEKKIPNLQIICIDPNPHSFTSRSKIYKAPDYATMDDYLSEHPKGNSNSILFLNWPETSLERGAGYDLDAIQKIQPHFVICLMAFLGCDMASAGSGSFHVMRDLDKSYDKKVVTTFTRTITNPEPLLATRPKFLTETFVMELWSLRKHMQRLRQQQWILL